MDIIIWQKGYPYQRGTTLATNYFECISFQLFKKTPTQVLQMDVGSMQVTFSASFSKISNKNLKTKILIVCMCCNFGNRDLQMSNLAWFCGQEIYPQHQKPFKHAVQTEHFNHVNTMISPGLVLGSVVEPQN